MSQRWEVVIGLETHVQLKTQSKIFSNASTAFGAAPNTQASVIDLALPGTLPVLNRAAVAHAIRFGLAVNATIAPRSVFARKHYFYPDLPKGYQISQYEIPVVQGGRVTFEVPGQGSKTINLTRAHLEEDAGKSLHEAYAGMSGIDLNRAGTPLLEIVTEPEMRSSAEAVAYAKTLHALVMWLDVCDGNMQEGSFRCDANVSVRPVGQAAFGTRCEIKNLNSFRFLQQAIDYEVRRQIELIEDGGKVVQQTRLYDPDRDETRSMRSKEDAMDYRYFPDPDLLPVQVGAAWIEQVKAEMPELPDAMRERFVRQYGLPESQSSVLTSSLAMAQYFESAASWVDAKLLATWISGELVSLLNRDRIEIDQAPVSAAWLAGLLTRLSEGQIAVKTAKEILDGAWGRNLLFKHLKSALPVEVLPELDQHIEANGLKQISDTGAIERIIDEVLTANPAAVAEFKAGKEKAFNSLVGQAMKATKGKANPQQVNEVLRARLMAA